MPTAYQSYQRLVNALKNVEIYFYISLEMAFFGMRQLQNYHTIKSYKVA